MRRPAPFHSAISQFTPDRPCSTLPPTSTPPHSALELQRRTSAPTDVSDALAAAAAAAAQRQQQRINFHVGVLHYTPSSEPFPLLDDAVEVRSGREAGGAGGQTHRAGKVLLECLLSKSWPHVLPFIALLHAAAPPAASRSTTPAPSTSTATPRRWPTGSASCRQACHCQQDGGQSPLTSALLLALSRPELHVCRICLRAAASGPA